MSAIIDSPRIAMPFVDGWCGLSLRRPAFGGVALTLCLRHSAPVEAFLGKRRSMQGLGFTRYLHDITTRHPFVSRSRAAILLRVGRATLAKMGLKDWPMESCQFAAFLDERRAVQDGE